jgi:hypothetical protein
MKKGFIFLSLALLGATNTFAQHTLRSARATTPANAALSAKASNSDLLVAPSIRTSLPKGLRVDIKIISVENMVVQETNPADMFTFRVYETTLLPQTNNSNSFNFQTCSLTEVFGFQVVGKPRLTVGLNGELTYNFSLTGLREGVSYGVDVFPVNNRVAAAPSYGLNKMGVTSSSVCNSLSAVSGSAIVVQFSPLVPPK